MDCLDARFSIALACESERMLGCANDHQDVYTQCTRAVCTESAYYIRLSAGGVFTDGVDTCG